MSIKKEVYIYLFQQLFKSKHLVSEIVGHLLGHGESLEEAAFFELVDNGPIDQGPNNQAEDNGLKDRLVLFLKDGWNVELGGLEGGPDLGRYGTVFVVEGLELNTNLPLAALLR